MKIEQYVMAYSVEQDKLRAILPEGFVSLRPVLRINAEVRNDIEGYVEFNTAVEKDGKRGWLNIGYWENVPFARDEKKVTFQTDFLQISFEGVGIEGSCPAEKDNAGCFFINADTEPKLRKPETITVNKEFCDCEFKWKFCEGDACGKSIGKTLPAISTEIRIVYPRADFTVENAAHIPCEQVLGTYVVVFERGVLKVANETIFTTKVNEYANSRPSYAPEAIDRIISKMLKKGDLIADVGSGTGIFSKEFLLRGYEVFGIEPNDAMRLEAEKAYGENKLFHSIPAAAEQTSLPANSISLVTAASAFHWFDIPQFYEECKRILKPDGIVCIIANARTYDSFTEKQHQICKQYCPKYTSLTHGVEKMIQKADSFFKGKFCIEKFDFPLTYTKQKFIARSLSSSYAPEKGTDDYEGYIHSLQSLLDDTFPDDKITIANETVMLWGKLS